MKLTANWSYPTSIRFGAGRISEIADACVEAGIKKPLLITDRGLANLDITRKTLDLLEAAGLGRAIFADVDPNPNEKNAAAGVKAYNEGEHDGVVAFGGGSGLDLGKLVAFMAGQNRPLLGFEDIGANQSNDGNKLSEAVNILIELRNQARSNKDFATSDLIRDQLHAAGIQLKDGKDGTSFTVD